MSEPVFPTAWPEYPRTQERLHARPHRMVTRSILGPLWYRRILTLSEDPVLRALPHRAVEEYDLAMGLRETYLAELARDRQAAAWRLHLTRTEIHRASLADA
jgi:hypothetical protein